MRHIALAMWGCVLLVGRWVVMGGQVPTFQPVDNPASFAENFFTRVNFNMLSLTFVLIKLIPADHELQLHLCTERVAIGMPPVAVL
jgi:Domain of unknown function (DUF1736)